MHVSQWRVLLFEKSSDSFFVNRCDLSPCSFHKQRNTLASICEMIENSVRRLQKDIMVVRRSEINCYFNN